MVAKKLSIKLCKKLIKSFFAPSLSAEQLQDRKLLEELGEKPVTLDNLVSLIALLTPFIATISLNFPGKGELTLNSAYISTTDFFKGDFRTPSWVASQTEIEKVSARLLR